MRQERGRVGQTATTLLAMQESSLLLQVLPDRIVETSVSFPNHLICRAQESSSFSKKAWSVLEYHWSWLTSVSYPPTSINPEAMKTFYDRVFPHPVHQGRNRRAQLLCFLRY